MKLTGKHYLAASYQHILLAVGLAGAHTMAIADDKADWSKSYYNSNTACTVAEISSVLQSPKGVIVTLEVEASTSLALSKQNVTERNSWMALHCPPENHKAWHKQAINYDVRIVASLPGMPRYELSCSEQHVNINKKRLHQTNSVAQRLKQLFSTADTSGAE